MKPSFRNPPRNRGYFSRPRAFCIEKYNISRSGYHSKFHRILRLPRKVAFQLHRILRLPRKVTLERHQFFFTPTPFYDFQSKVLVPGNSEVFIHFHRLLLSEDFLSSEISHRFDILSCKCISCSNEVQGKNAQGCCFKVSHTKLHLFKMYCCRSFSLAGGTLSS